MYTVTGTVGTRTLRVLWMLEELGLPFTHVDAGPGSPEARAGNPSGKVPILDVEGVKITDSTAILTFLADRHQMLTFPAGSLDRARQDSLTHFVLDELEAAVWTAARHSFVLPAERRVPAIKETLRWELGRSQNVLAGRMDEGPFLMGEVMTVPDIILAHCLGWMLLAKFEITAPGLRGFLDRMRARPAFQRAIARRT
jgi:glutathione S-transferase